MATAAVNMKIRFLIRGSSSLNPIGERTKTGLVAKDMEPLVVLIRAQVPSQELISKERAQTRPRTLSTARRHLTTERLANTEMAGLRIVSSSHLAEVESAIHGRPYLVAPFAIFDISHMFV